MAETQIYAVEHDSHGDERVVGEIILIGQARDIARANGAGFREISSQALASGGVITRLGAPQGMSVEDAARRLRRLAPRAIVTANNIYRSAEALVRTQMGAVAAAPAPLRGVLGVIDTGVDTSALPPNAVLSHQAFAGAAPIAHEHGSLVASIAVANGARVQVADVFGHSTDGALAASAERIASALDWMIANRVAVINISIEGPNNAILAEMIERAAERGHLIVAAAGNGGPTARPSFPAAFNGVLAVTAIDTSGAPYFRANRGAYIDFAAPGVDVPVALNGAVLRATGTSFAAPVISALAAAHLSAPSPRQSNRVVEHLRAGAEDLGAPGRDNVFGWGALRD
ncbi:S8 family serine peptidase [Candidatus Viadribacter manganicus]|uniref:Peptidase S8/S53 domain-containing protein n=1 Tax=Candidatus Viadribacter manganicus TaxID=1759059 RepID=A0A1B1AGM0_9PROT|nr:S8 family serine peptidase [Candidatus Viadribacter manganicus]ANP45712.1 hypothetical protein ATE48_07165 [Candidatus Viadribacter manganicus]